MELHEVLQEMMQDSQKAAMPCELVIGTVTNEKPLRIKYSASMPELQPQVLYLTEPVVEKKIPILEHTHAGVHGQTGPALLIDEIICKEYKKDLPIQEENGKKYIIFNRKLEKNDKVLMLKVEHGQKFVILSRVFEVS